MTSHFSYHNNLTRFDVEGMGWYRSQTIHCSSHKPVYRGILFTSSVSSCCVDKNHEKEKGDISFDDSIGRQSRSRDDGGSRNDIIFDGGRRGSRSKEFSHFSSRNMV